MIPEELIHGIEGGVGSRNRYSYDLIYDLVPFRNAKKRIPVLRIG